MAFNYRKINYDVMIDTKRCYESMPELKEAVEDSIARQFMVAEEECIDQPIAEKTSTRYIVSGKRSFEAAKGYAGKKTAVLNYANNHFIGGAPFSAGAQEESLCRCSTLYPCLQAMKKPFYEKHSDMYHAGEMDFMGNDDLIYTPDVIVFKTDERTDPVYPKMMNHDEWYKVNVITCAAPQMSRVNTRPDNYEAVIRSRIKKILDVATKEGNEVVILGAWGCGAFNNSIEIVSKTFVELLKNYDFEIVEFALATTNDVSSSAFARALWE
ncbi:MAG: TIGR02452 family protein [Prevotella sp.]|nr:TIGR02452 family protein [Prevotella sp.]